MPKGKLRRWKNLPIHSLPKDVKPRYRAEAVREENLRHLIVKRFFSRYDLLVPRYHSAGIRPPTEKMAENLLENKHYMAIRKLYLSISSLSSNELKMLKQLVESIDSKIDGIILSKYPLIRRKNEF